MKKKPPIFLALDLDSKSEALALAEKTHKHVLGYKIGPRLFFSSLSGSSDSGCSGDLPAPRAGQESGEARSLIAELKRLGSPKIFLDFKFHDIPSSVLGAVKAACRMGADYATVHAAAGAEAMEALREWQSRREADSRPFKILFVTALTSLPRSKEIQKKVEDLAGLTVRHGFDGLVCSPWELAPLRKKHPHAFLVSPGIRLKGESHGDQKRVMTPREALREGASALVMGRSLSQAKDPAEALKKICASL